VRRGISRVFYKADLSRSAPPAVVCSLRCWCQGPREKKTTGKLRLDLRLIPSPDSRLDQDPTVTRCVAAAIVGVVGGDDG